MTHSGLPPCRALGLRHGPLASRGSSKGGHAAIRTTVIAIVHSESARRTSIIFFRRAPAAGTEFALLERTLEKEDSNGRDDEEFGADCKASQLAHRARL